MPPKKQTYKESFLNFGVTSVIEKPQCVICCEVSTQESMKPSKLKQHFESCQGDLVGKSAEYLR